MSRAISTKELNVLIGKRIKFFRELAGMTQEEFSKCLGYKSSGIISMIERGVRGMKKSKMVEAAKCLNVHQHILSIENDIPNEYLVLLNDIAKLMTMNKFHGEIQALKAIVESLKSKV